MTKPKALLIASPLLLFLLPACSLEQLPSKTTFNFDPAALAKRYRATRHAVPADRRMAGQFDQISRMLQAPGAPSYVATPGAPTGLAGFSCFAVNVTADEIPAYGGSDVVYEGDPDCTYPGVTSQFVPASASGASMTVSVPSGHQRTIQVVGVQAPTGACPIGGSLVDNIYNTAFTGIYELGRVTTDVFAGSAIDVKSTYTPANPKSPFSCRAYKYYAYVLNSNGGGGATGTVDVYSIALADGSLTLVQQGVSTGTGATAIATDPMGRFVYVVNGTAGTVSQYSIVAATGKLTAIGGPVSVAPVTGAKSIAVDPYGEFAFVGGSGGGTDLNSFAINQTTGALTSNGTVASGGTDVAGAVVDPTGYFLMTANLTSSNLSSSNISVTGALSAVVGSPFAYTSGATSPKSITADPTAWFAFAGNTGGNKGVSSFFIALDGSLSEVGSPADATYQYPTVAANPYLAGLVYGGESPDGGVATFTYDLNTGVIAYAGYSGPPAGAVTMNQITVDPLGYYVYALWDEGQLASYPILGNGFATSDGSHVVTESPTRHPVGVAVGRVPQ